MRACGLLAASLLVGLAVPAQAAPPPTPVSAPPATASSTPQTPAAATDSALAEAKRTGQPVEVPEHTTETSKVEALPNGSVKLTSSARPTRVKRDGKWQNVDLTLKARPDGSLAPAVSPVDVVFGGGGTAPAVTFADGDRKIALSWPGELPKPKLDKDSAVYPEVLPGVDLRVTAGLSGFTEVLVVKNAEAARNPALTAVKLLTHTQGMTLRTAPDGTLSTVDGAGQVVFQGSTPIMWDSTKMPDGATPTASDPGKVTKLSVTQQTAQPQTAQPQVAQPGVAARTASPGVTITPAPEALTGKDVVYPVYIDPGLSRGKEAWLGLTDKNWRQYNTNYPAQVGYCNWANCGETFRSRSFFRFDTSAVQARNGHRATLTGAAFYALQTHSTWNDCRAEPTDLYWGHWFDGGTSWPGPEGGWSGTSSSGRGDNCRDGAGTVRFEAGNAVQTAINNNWERLTVYLRAPDEGNKYQWKKFDANPTLEATFNFPPNTPGGLGVVEAVDCYGRLTSPVDRPTLTATATDNNNPPLDLSIGFEVWTADEKNHVRSGSTTIPSNGRASWAPGEALPDGEYKYRARATNLTGDAAPGITSGWSGWRSFSVHAAAVTGYPDVFRGFRDDYPVGNWGQQAGSPGTIRFNHNWDSPSDEKIVGFAYSFDGPGTTVQPERTDCDYDRSFGLSGGWVSTKDEYATIVLPPGLSPGRHTVHTRSFNDAHRMGPEKVVAEFYVAPATGGGTTLIEAESMQVSLPVGQHVETSVQDSSCCDFKWSGNKQRMIQFTAVGQKADFAFTVPNTGDPTGAQFEIGAGITKSWDYGLFQYYIDGQPVAHSHNGTPDPVQQYSASTMRAHEVLSYWRLTPGTHKLTVEVKDTFSPHQKYFFGLDYLTLSTTSRYEAEKLPVTQPAGQNAAVATRTKWNYFGDGLSGGMAQQLTGGATGQSFDLTFRVPIEADYALGAVLFKEESGAKVEVQVDGAPLAHSAESPRDSYQSTGMVSDYFSLGGLHLTAGEHKMTFKVAGKNERATNTNIVVDYLTAVPINNVTAASFEAAMNNDGIGDTTANLDFEQSGLSAASLAAVGLAPGQQKTVNGATFTMPRPKADGSDNVVSLGQRIPLPQPVQASAIGLLVTSTCGTTRPASATISYVNDKGEVTSTQNQVVPEVTDWADGPEEAAEFVLPNRVGGGDPVKPRLQVLFVHADPSKTAKYVTLPNYGTSLMPGCPQAALHVLAMAPRPVDAGWAGTWAAPADQLVTPPSGGLKDRTIRTVIDPSVTGTQVRITLQNPNPNEPMTVGAASIGAQAGTDTATVAAPTALKFGGSASVTIPAGGEVVSDAAAYPAGGTGKLVVSTYFTSAVTKAPVHGFVPSYLSAGNRTGEQVQSGTKIDGVYYLAGVQIAVNNGGTVVVLGDQFSAHADNWVDRLPDALRQEGGQVPGGLVNASRAGVDGVARTAGVTMPPSGAGAATARNTWWTLDRSVSQPNLRTVVISLGANDVLAGRSKAQIIDDVRALVHPANAGSLRNIRRADGSLVHVILATVAPLGLAADDPRELVRQDVNAALRNEYVNLGADGVLDMAAMVAEPGEDNLIAGDLLTDGVPNARFHEKVAREVAVAVTGFPPLEL